MKIVEGGHEHPWVPGGRFIQNPELQPLLLYLETLPVERVSDLREIVHKAHLFDRLVTVANNGFMAPEVRMEQIALTLQGLT